MTDTGFSRPLVTKSLFPGQPLLDLGRVFYLEASHANSLLTETSLSASQSFQVMTEFQQLTQPEVSLWPSLFTPA